MATYNFTVVLEGDVDSNLDGLFEAGCDDATFGSVDGVPYADFDRDAGTFSDAIATAIRDVESVRGLRVRRIEPDDLVTTAEIAARLHRTRESVRLLAAGKRGSKPFPAPISHIRRRTRLWRWSDVAAWAGVDPETDAQLVAALNAALELREVSPAVRRIAESTVGYCRD
ncbi:MAG TPA: hypothetical protein VK821_07885 [Dehalococcoidia bacterium]|nr:hypothetical protein [Dehalococcoidia bacterium]